MEARIVYFADPEKDYADEVFAVVRKRSEELGIKTIVIASTKGNAAVKAMDALKGLRVIVVRHATGFDEPGSQPFTEANRKIVESKGGIILTTTHIFAAIGRAMKNKFNMFGSEEIIANTLRVFGHGMKVVCEIAMMAADSGLVGIDEDIIVIAGRHEGANTAVLLRPVNTVNFFDLKIKEILCIPRF